MAGAVTSTSPQPSPAVAFDQVSFSFDEHIVLRDVSFEVPKGSMRIVLGRSGSGKSVMIKLILGLLKPDSGAIYVNGERVDTMREQDLFRVRADVGMMFQENALFDSLTVGENVGYRLVEELGTPLDEAALRVKEVLGYIGLADFTDRLPSLLSGGQRKRVAIARAFASKPGLILYDDPTTGLDPILSTTVDDEIVKLRDLEGVTSMLVTHQIRDAFYIAGHRAVRTTNEQFQIQAADSGSTNTNFMVLHDGRIYFEGNAAELTGSADEFLKEFLFMTLPPW